MKNKIEIKSTTLEGKDITVYLIRPRNKENIIAQKNANLTFSEAINSGAMFRSQLVDHMKSKGMWSDDKQKEIDDIDDRIEKNLSIIKKGGIKLSEAKKLAIKVRSDRFRKALLLTERNKLDDFTVEGQTENIRFDTLVSLCIVNDEGKPIFNGLDDYRDNADEPYAIKAASTLANLLYDIDDEWESKLPENVFLRNHRLINDDLRLVNKDGKLVDIDGRLINDDGYYINENGERIDENGNRIDENGLLIVESEPFLDDDGNPIIEE